MISFFYDITWHCDGNCDMNVLHDDCHTLSWHIVPSIFRKRGKEKREKQDRKSLSEKYKRFYMRN